MNKTIYVAPAIKEIKVRAISMIANSPTVKPGSVITKSDEIANDTEADSRSNRFWDDEEEDW